MKYEEAVKNGMQEVLPSEEQQRIVKIYKSVMAQVFVRYTPKEERIKWFMPCDDVSEWNVEELDHIRVYRRAESVKVEVKYYSLPWEGFCKDQVDLALTKVLVEMSKFINLDVHFDTLIEISMNIYRLVMMYKAPVLVKDMRNFMTSFIVEFDEIKLLDLSSEVIFHDSNAFERETDPEKLAKGDEWKALTLVNCTGACEPGKADWPPERYIVLRDQYAKGKLGKDFRVESFNKEREENPESVSVRDLLEANGDHYNGAHDYCMAILQNEK